MVDKINLASPERKKKKKKKKKIIGAIIVFISVKIYIEISSTNVITP